MKLFTVALAMFILTSSAFSIVQTCGEAAQCPGGSGSGGGTGGGGTTTSCTVTVFCWGQGGNMTGSVSCTSVNNSCYRGADYVICDLAKTDC